MDDNPRQQERESFLAVLKKKLSRKKKDTEHNTENQDETEAVIKEAFDDDVIDYDEMDMIKNIIRFSETDVEDIMVHRTNISAIDGSMTIKEVFDRIMEDGFSRYPVWLDRPENIVGIFHIRDYLKAYADYSERNVSLIDSKYDVVYDAAWVPLTRDISSCFKEMQREKIHMVMIGNEYGQLEGLVTMEDILEEIFGNIQDEHDEQDDELIHPHANEANVYTVEPFARLEDVEKVLGIEFDADDVDTMNGYMTAKLGHIPKDGEEFMFSYSGYKFSIKKAEDNIVKETLIEKF